MSFESLSNEHVPRSSEVFLDTSIHCALRKGPLFAERVNRVLDLFGWISTSSYAKVEFGNVVLAQAEYFLRQLENLGSLAKLQGWIGNVLPLKWRASQKKVTWTFNLLAQVYGKNDEECTERAMLSLRRLMKTGVAAVDAICDQPIANGTDCYWAKKGVHQRKDGRLEWKTPICRREQKRCRLDDFFQSNVETFRKIRDTIESLPEERKTAQLKDFSEVISRAIEDPAILLDYATGCRRLADAIIAVDSVGYKSMFSQNVAESEVLCETLDQDFYYLPSNPERGLLLKTSKEAG